MTDVVAEQTPPVLLGPSEKERKYDRQLRLWAANGQAALEDAHVLLVNSGSGTVGVETLKNLVLPGIGKFTIADDDTVKEADLGVNFFLDEKCLGKLRSQSCADLLQELNPDVKGGSIGVGNLFKARENYTFILYTFPIDGALLESIEAYSRRYEIPLVSINSAGFYSYFRIHLPGSFPIVDTHPDSEATTDLRLLSPWTELVTFARDMTAKIDELDNHAHGHIPYVILLLCYLEHWKMGHDGKSPQTYAEKTAFRKMIAEAARTDTPDGREENYDEAVAAVLKTITAPTLSSSVREVFDYVPDETEATTNFWILTDAVKKFYARHTQLPLPGSIPDMKAQSEVYVRLQNIYKTKARQDVAEVKQIVQINPHGNNIPDAEIESYCKNAAFIKLIKSNTGHPSNLQTLVESELNAEFALSPTLIPIYLALKASETLSKPTKAEILVEIGKSLGDVAEHTAVIEAAHEVARARGGELHNISALTGGIIAQEVIKIITKQYIPIENACIFDGITSRTQVVRL